REAAQIRQALSLVVEDDRDEQVTVSAGEIEGGVLLVEPDSAGRGGEPILLPINDDAQEATRSKGLTEPSRPIPFKVPVEASKWGLIELPRGPAKAEADVARPGRHEAEGAETRQP